MIAKDLQGVQVAWTFHQHGVARSKKHRGDLIEDRWNAIGDEDVLVVQRGNGTWLTEEIDDMMTKSRLTGIFCVTPIGALLFADFIGEDLLRSLGKQTERDHRTIWFPLVELDRGRIRFIITSIFQIDIHVSCLKKWRKQKEGSIKSKRAFLFSFHLNDRLSVLLLLLFLLHHLAQEQILKNEQQEMKLNVCLAFFSSCHSIADEV